MVFPAYILKKIIDLLEYQELTEHYKHLLNHLHPFGMCKDLKPGIKLGTFQSRGDRSTIMQRLFMIALWVTEFDNKVLLNQSKKCKVS